jgi:hypothetical protein
MKAPLAFVFLVTATLSVASRSKNTLPPAAARALSAPSETIIYSLEPTGEIDASEPRLQHWKILGQTALDQKQTTTAINAFKSAISGWDGITAMCFNPRQAIRVVANSHTYDFLLCYECHQLYVYEDDKLLRAIGAAGSSEVLDGLLTAQGIALAKTESPEEIAAAQTKDKESVARWVAAMPKSLRRFWTEEMRQGMPPLNLKPLRRPLAQEFPDIRQRVLALFKWYGSGEGGWSVSPAYEDIPEKLLLEFPTPQLIAATEGTELTDAQLEGAARLFAGWNGTKREDDLKMLPLALKRRLLEHSLKSTDSDKQEWAKNAFEEP